jgi:hypothetical protein
MFREIRGLLRRVALNKACLIVIISTLLCGCNKQSEKSYQLDWAVVNKSVLENEIYELVKKNNPYAGDTIMNVGKLSSGRARLSREIYYLKADVIKKCMSSRKKPDKEKKLSASQQDELLYGVYARTPSEERSVSLGQPRYDKVCLDQAESDPLVAELTKRKVKLDKMADMRSKYQSRLREFSKEYAQSLLAQHAKSKYEIVVNGSENGRESNILYNAQGLKLDVTKHYYLKSMKVSLYYRKIVQASRQGFS